MGQTAATEVFCYYIQGQMTFASTRPCTSYATVVDTVEENILRMGARRGLSLYAQDTSRSAIDISEFAMETTTPQVDAPSKKVRQKGDFVEKAEDLIHVLFPHLDYREEDFEVFSDVGRGGNVMDVDSEDGVAGPSGSRSGHTNAIAGPSRLR